MNNLFDVNSQSHRKKYKFYDSRNSFAYSIHKKSHSNQISSKPSTQKNTPSPSQQPVQKQLDPVNSIQYVERDHSNNIKAEAPHFWISREIELTEAVSLLKDISTSKVS